MITQKEIIERAVRFSKEWSGAKRENSDKQSYWNDFFAVFGIERKKVARFEETVKKYGGNSKFVDLFWKGELVVEHKSLGEDLDKAYQQAEDYCKALKERNRPKYIVVSDFARIRVYDLIDSEKDYDEIQLADLHKNTDLFGFISGYSRRKYRDEAPVNKKGALLIGKLHDVLRESKYTGADLESFLVRILFCLFAEDTTIFAKGTFREFIDEDTYEDGSNVGSQLIYLFEILNKPEDKRQTTLPERLKVFPYVNGALFADKIDTPAFNKEMRDTLLECCYFDWSGISPAIFGTMFQAIIHGVKRDELGAHYTSEKNILKAVHGLFLDELQREFDKAKNNSNKLKEFHNKIASLKFLDPACGCGNFLVIAYREMREFEIEILKQLRVLSGSNQLTIPLLQSQIQLDSFCGIEYDESAVRISEVAMWLMEHKMNEKLTGELGKYIATVPLKKSPHIILGNALQTDWNAVVPNSSCSYIIGNPPFVSQKNRTAEQKEDMAIVFGSDASVLDYVCAWYKKAADYIEGTKIKVALVSTNSITQGEQVGALWHYLLPKNIKIHFAHRTFRWDNEAKGQAQVFVVIIGFANYDTDEKYIYDYATPKSEPVEVKAKNINAYLIDFEDILVTNRSKPICNVPQMQKGSQPTDGGNFLFTDAEKNEFLILEPKAKKFIHPFISSKEYISGKKRWCLWLYNAEPNELDELPNVMKRVQAVREFRLKSPKEATKKWAGKPRQFTEKRQPDSDYILVPSHSSEIRDYVPMGFMTKNDIVSNSCFSVPNASLYDFGVLTSEMHMAWMRYVCGRIKSDYRYSNTIVYNNFPFPENVSDKNEELVTQKAQAVLDARENHTDSTLENLYKPNMMPDDLRKAHQELDKAVDKCYGNQTFKTEMERIRFLFGLYEKLTQPLLADTVKAKGKRK